VSYLKLSAIINQNYKHTITDGGDELSKIIVAAYARYCVSNPLHPDVFPAIRKMEAEIVAMCLKMYRGPEGSAGAMTSGGTESIIMAMKTHRDWARATKGITEPEMFVVYLTIQDFKLILFAELFLQLPTQHSTKVVPILVSKSTQSLSTIILGK